MKRLTFPLLALAALAFGLSAVVAWLPTWRLTEPPSPPPESSFAHTVAAVGLIEASTENIAIGSHLSGVVEAVFVTVGDAVSAGEALFKLDDRHLRAQLVEAQAGEQAAEARVAVAVAALNDATRQLGFVEGLMESGAVSAEEVARRLAAVQIARAKVREANAEVRAAAARIERIHTDLQRSVVTAPTDGQVLQVKLRPGEFVAAGPTAGPMMLLGQSTPLHLRVDVDEHEAWRVHPDARAVAHVRGNAQLRTPLAFVRFEPFVVPKRSLTGDATERVDTRVLQVIYRIERDDLRLFVGQQMDVFIDAPGNGSP
jgi:RND family efflux transporter MFP subunit